MTSRRIVAAAAVLPIAAVLSACQREAERAPANQSILAPTPTPTPSMTPTAKPSPRSIMQPSVEPAITPPPLQPLNVTIGFPDGGAKLDAAATAGLDGVLTSPVMMSGGPIVLRGSSDSRGSDADNKLASKHRAQAVAAYLVAKGVDEARLTIVALGEDRPLAPNANLDGSDNEEGRRKNRRVDIVVSPPPEQPPKQPNETAGAASIENAATPPENAI